MNANNKYDDNNNNESCFEFVVHPKAKGTNKPVPRIITMLGNSIENSVLNNEYTNKGKTVKEVTVMIATTVCSLPPVKFTTKGAPKPVEIPDSKNTDRYSFV